jgi:hypothetical protein
MAIGLSSGFVEPLESTGIHIIIQQIQHFIEQNATLKDLEYNRTQCNNLNMILYEEIVEFICLHYNTNRTDSKFWRYMTENKSDFVREFDEKCREEFIQSSNIDVSKHFWTIDSYIQCAHGLEMFNLDSIKEYVSCLDDPDSILEDCRLFDREIKKAKGQGSSQKDMFNFINFIEQNATLNQ